MSGELQENSLIQNLKFKTQSFLRIPSLNGYGRKVKNPGSR